MEVATTYFRKLPPGSKQIYTLPSLSHHLPVASASLVIHLAMPATCSASVIDFPCLQRKCPQASISGLAPSGTGHCLPVIELAPTTRLRGRPTRHRRECDGICNNILT